MKPKAIDRNQQKEKPQKVFSFEEVKKIFEERERKKQITVQK